MWNSVFEFMKYKGYYEPLSYPFSISKYLLNVSRINVT